jgi:hypothetical protein
MAHDTATAALIAAAKAGHVALTAAIDDLRRQPAHAELFAELVAARAVVTCNLIAAGIMHPDYAPA